MHQTQVHFWLSHAILFTRFFCQNSLAAGSSLKSFLSGGIGGVCAVLVRFSMPSNRKLIISVVFVLNKFCNFFFMELWPFSLFYYRLVIPLILSSKTVTAFMLSFSSFFSLCVLICVYVWWNKLLCRLHCQS
jgi:hypothetical protein